MSCMDEEQCSNVIRKNPHRFEYERRIVKIAVNEAQPFLSLNTTTEGNIILIDGPEFHILQAFMELFNVEFDIRPSSDGEWGRLVNGTWTGLVGMVSRNEVDMAAGCLSVTASRMSSISFSAYYDVVKSVIVTRTPSKKSKVYAVLLPFSKLVWALLLLTLLFITFVLYSVGRVYSMMVDKKPTSLSRIFWYCFGSWTAEGGNLMKMHGTASAIVLAGWLVFVLIMQASYSGMLMTVLTLQGYERAIQSMYDLAEAVTSRGMKCCCLKGSINCDTLMSFEEEPLSAISKTFAEDKHSSVNSLEKALEMVAFGNYAIILQEVSSRYFAKKMSFKDLYFSDIAMDMETFAFPIAETFQLREELDYVIRRTFETGLIAKWLKKQITTLDQRLSHATDTPHFSAVPLTMTELHGALMLYVYGASLACVVFVGELLFHYKQKYKSKISSAFHKKGT